ncbi:MAG: radical SAM protein [Deltaproteobacteria bacterium]|nr:radical SAM protein [Deltaproteobacteria bacterium]
MTPHYSVANTIKTYYLTSMNPSIILINPWIYDFAAYDLWSKPLGLLYIAGYLKKLGLDVHYIDCLDVYHPDMVTGNSIHHATRRRYGTGKYWRQAIQAPPALSHINRIYSRYGITKELFIKELQRIHSPSAILVTSLMTYWYPGVVEAISIAKEIHPHTPVILGGIYARLCEGHAKKRSGADHVSTETILPDMDSILNLLKGFDIPVPRIPADDVTPIYPAFDLLNKPGYVCIMTSTGCPYRCRYCASSYLYPEFTRRDPLEVREEIRFWNREYRISDFAFYDDALLVKSEGYAAPMMEGIIRDQLKIRFHTPNALHVKEISREIAGLLYASGFRMIRLGLETSDIDRHNNLDNKVSEGDFERAVHNLLKAGFKRQDIGAYVLMGLPGQSIKSVEDTIRFVGAVGAVPYLAEYSPIPHTSLWDDAVKSSSYDISTEPLFHNNTILPCWDEDRRQKVPGLRQMVREIRQEAIA